MIHQLLVLHEAAAAEVAGPRAPRDARPCRARRGGAGVGAARPPGEVKQHSHQKSPVYVNVFNEGLFPYYIIIFLGVLPPLVIK